MSVSRGDGLLGSIGELSSGTQHPFKKLSMAACTCNPKADGDGGGYGNRRTLQEK